MEYKPESRFGKRGLLDYRRLSPCPLRPKAVEPGLALLHNRRFEGPVPIPRHQRHRAVATLENLLGFAVAAVASILALGGVLGVLRHQGLRNGILIPLAENAPSLFLKVTIPIFRNWLE